MPQSQTEAAGSTLMPAAAVNATEARGGAHAGPIKDGVLVSLTRAAGLKGFKTAPNGPRRHSARNFARLGEGRVRADDWQSAASRKSKGNGAGLAPNLVLEPCRTDHTAVRRATVKFRFGETSVTDEAAEEPEQTSPPIVSQRAEYEVTPTSPSTAEVTEIPLSPPEDTASGRTRQVLRTRIIDNSRDAESPVNADVVHQRRGSLKKSWDDSRDAPLKLSTIKAGTEVRVHLGAFQTKKLYESLRDLYASVRQAHHKRSRR